MLGYSGANPRKHDLRARVFLLFLTATWMTSACAQAPEPASDLARAAAQAKAERERQRALHSSNSDAVNEMASELAERADSAPTGAPIGYRYFYFKEGDYYILVPEDAEIQGRGEYGLTLLSSEVVGSRTQVSLGEPIAAEGDTPLQKFRNAAARYASGCAPAMSGLTDPVNGHPAAKAGFSACPLQKQLMGYAQFVLNGDSVVPVLCGYPYLAEDWDTNPRIPVAKIFKKYDRESNGVRACNVIFPSIVFNQHGADWRPSKAPTTSKKAVATNALQVKDSAQEIAPGNSVSLGALAQGHKKASSKPIMEELTHAAPGFYSFPFRYCGKDGCFDAEIQLPTKAHREEVHSALFEFSVPVGDSVAVIEAMTGMPTEGRLISREEIVRTKFDWWIRNTPPAYFSDAGTAEVLSEELTTLAGMSVRLHSFRSPTAFKPVVTQLAAYMTPGVFVHIRCAAPEAIYADAKAMCQQVVRSLEIPRSKQASDQSDDDDH